LSIIDIERQRDHRHRARSRARRLAQRPLFIFTPRDACTLFFRNTPISPPLSFRHIPVLLMPRSSHLMPSGDIFFCLVFSLFLPDYLPVQVDAAFASRDSLRYFQFMPPARR
jgi:hypothetical protein